MDYGGGDGVDAVLLRDDEELQALGIVEGAVHRLDMREMGVAGWACVRSVEPCPPLEAGPGQLVTGWFHHWRGVVYDLWVEGEPRPIRVTALHPFWSVDRQAWVPLSELHRGERLSAWNGSTPVVESLTLREDPEPVYNIEVEGDHCYRVGQQGLLVHNASCPAVRDTDALTKSLGASPYPSNVPPRAHHIFPVSEFDTPLGRKLCCWGIDLNSAENGVWLPYCDYPKRKASVHRGSNTKQYIDDVVAEVGMAKNKADALAILADIKARLLDGTLKLNNADEKKPC